MSDATHGSPGEPDPPKKTSPHEPSQDDYQRLLAFRVRLRQHNAWLEQALAPYGLTFQQFQLMIAVRGHPGPRPPSVSDLAGYLMLRLNSTIELINRCEQAGCALKVRDRLDGRVVRVELTAKGERGVAEMAVQILPGLIDLCRILTDVAVARDQLEDGS